jgi:imidazole glycerol-phosphate synthase subunit HisH
VIALVDYGAGNLTSVRKALVAVGASVFTPRSACELAGAAGVVVPGVGHFSATRSLDSSWRHAIAAAVDEQTPLLGICLGMQWLFEGSEEAPNAPGLGVFEGFATRLQDRDTNGNSLKVPHVGWNRVVRGRGASMPGGEDGGYFYFTHTYAAPVTPDCAGVTDYGGPFASAVGRGQVWGVQFHPEKSGTAGLAVLKAFVETCGARIPAGGNGASA